MKTTQGFDTQVFIETEATPGKRTNDLKDHCSDKGSCGIEKEECHTREHPTRPDETGASPGVLEKEATSLEIESTTVPEVDDNFLSCGFTVHNAGPKVTTPSYLFPRRQSPAAAAVTTAAAWRGPLQGRTD